LRLTRDLDPRPFLLSERRQHLGDIWHSRSGRKAFERERERGVGVGGRAVDWQTLASDSAACKPQLRAPCFLATAIAIRKASSMGGAGRIRNCTSSDPIWNLDKARAMAFYGQAATAAFQDTSEAIVGLQQRGGLGHDE